MGIIKIPVARWLHTVQTWLVGYAPGTAHRLKPALGLGKAEAWEPNRDHWALTLFDPEAVPGCFLQCDLAINRAPSYRDIPALASTPLRMHAARRPTT